MPGDSSSITKLLLYWGFRQGKQQAGSSRGSTQGAASRGAAHGQCWSQCVSPHKPQPAGSCHSSQRAAELPTKAVTRSQRHGQHTGVLIQALGQGQQQEGTHLTDQLLLQLLGWLKLLELLSISHISAISLFSFFLILSCSRHLWRRRRSTAHCNCPNNDVGGAFSFWLLQPGRLGAEQRGTTLSPCPALIQLIQGGTKAAQIAHRLQDTEWDGHGEQVGSQGSLLSLHKKGRWPEYSHQVHSVNLPSICNPFKAFPSNITSTVTALVQWALSRQSSLCSSQHHQIPTQPVTGPRLSSKSAAAADPSQQLF